MRSKRGKFHQEVRLLTEDGLYIFVRQSDGSLGQVCPTCGEVWRTVSSDEAIAANLWGQVSLCADCFEAYDGNSQLMPLPKKWDVPEWAEARCWPLLEDLGVGQVAVLSAGVSVSVYRLPRYGQGN